MALEIARRSEMLVHVRQPQRALAQDLVKRAEEAGYGIERLAVETGPLTKLPYADRLIDLVVVPRMNAERVDAEKLADWARRGGASDVSTRAEGEEGWIQFSAPPLVGADDWSHWEKEPDNNPVSTDQIIRAPYMTQFLAEPYYIGMPSVTTAAAGRTFLAIGHIAHHRREWTSCTR